MTLLWCDGFEAYTDVVGGVPSPTDVMDWKYESVSTSAEFDFETGRNGTALEFPGTQAYDTWIQTGNLTTNSTLIAGIAYYYWDEVYIQEEEWALFEFYDGAQRNISLCWTSGAFFVKNANDEVIGVPRFKTDRIQYNYIEMKVVTHPTAGSVEVRVNGAPCIVLSNINTKFGTNNYCTRVSLGDGPTNSQVNSRIDDWYVCDGAGSTNNDFLGDITVHTIYPDGDDSVNFSVTGNGSYATHYEQVGYSNALDTTDYIDDSTAGHRDIFTCQTSSNFSTIHGIIGWVLASATASTEDYSIVVDSNGTETESANITATTTCSTEPFVVEQDPDASAAWTPSTINAMKFGIENK